MDVDKKKKITCMSRNNLLDEGGEQLLFYRREIQEEREISRKLIEKNVYT